MLTSLWFLVLVVCGMGVVGIAIVWNEDACISGDKPTGALVVWGWSIDGPMGGWCTAIG